MLNLPELSLEPKELERLDKKVGELKLAYQMEEPALKEIRDFVLPYRGKFSGEKANKDGERKDKRVLNHEAVLALRTLAAGMQSGVTSPARPWFKLALSDPTEASEEVRVYLEDTQKRIELVLSQSNFYNSVHALYAELGGFGTSTMFIDEDYDSVIRCRTLTMGEYWLGQNDRLAIDKVARRLEYTAGQLISEFGLESIPQSIRETVKQNADSEKKDYVVYHLVEPNPKHNPVKYENDGRITPTVYRGVYWLEGYKEQPLRVDGYHERPFVAPRWDVVSDAIYGRGPAWESLGLVKATNRIESDFYMGLAKQVNPPILVPEDIKDVNVYPGALIPYTEGSALNANSKIAALYNVQPDLASAQQKIDRNEEKINSFFYADLFAMITMTGNADMTAREVVERHEEKMIMLGPVLEQLYAELLNVAIERIYSIMARNGMLMDTPEELEGADIKVEYISILAQAQKMSRRNSITDTLNFVSGVMAAGFPTAGDRVDIDEAVKQYSDLSGTPAGVIYGDDKYEQIKAAREAQQQQLEQMEQMAQAGAMADGAANTAKTLSETQTTGPNALADIAAQIGGM